MFWAVASTKFHLDSALWTVVNCPNTRLSDKERSLILLDAVFTQVHAHDRCVGLSGTPASPFPLELNTHPIVVRPCSCSSALYVYGSTAWLGVGDKRRTTRRDFHHFNAWHRPRGMPKRKYLTPEKLATVLTYLVKNEPPKV